MSLKQTCKYCGEKTLAKRILGSMLGLATKRNFGNVESVLVFGV